MSTLAGDFWVCGDCRSINNAGARQCYNCRTPRDLAAVDPSAIDPSSHGPLRRIELPEFKSSRWAAMLASVLIVAVGVMQVVQFSLLTQLFDYIQAGTATEEQFVYFGSVGILAWGIALLALIAWALWLSRTVTSMPALGLGYPAANGLMAFVENFIPLLNLWRVPAIVRDVARRLERRTGGDETMTRGEALVFAAWISVFGGYLVPRVLSFFTDNPDTLVTITGIGLGLGAVGAVFLVVLIWWIEGKVLRRREAQVAEASASVDGAATPPTADPAFAAAAAEAVTTRPAFAAVTSATVDGAQSFRLPATEDAAAAPMGDEMPLAIAAEQAQEETTQQIAAEPAAASPPPVSGATPPQPAKESAPPAAPAMAPEPAGPATSPEPDPPATPEPAPPPAAPPPVQAGPPDLTIRISSRGLMTAELDGEVEHVMLDDLTPYAEALSHVGGSATIHVPADESMPSLIARRAQRILEDAGVKVTIA
jgi:Domain of unknown function (DUF4328)